MPLNLGFLLGTMGLNAFSVVLGAEVTMGSLCPWTETQGLHVTHLPHSSPGTEPLAAMFSVSQ